MPTLEAAYYRIISELEDISDSEAPGAMLKKICLSYELKSAAYLGTNVVHPNLNEPLLVVTYSTDWVHHYKSKNYVIIDPVIKSGFSSLLPIDWNNFDVRSQSLRTFFGEASEFGLGRSGLTFPIRGNAGERALFTITSDMNAKQWGDALQYLKRDFQSLGCYLHQKIIRSEGIEAKPIRLAPREIECLKWKAEGKTTWEISVILSISVKTVDCYLEQARRKLSAVNATHAAIKAFSLNLL